MPTTTVKQVDLQDIDSWLPSPGGDNVITGDPKKPTILSNPDQDFSFLDNTPGDDPDNQDDPDDKGGADSPDDPNKDSVAAPKTADQIAAELDDLDNPDDATKAGRPKTDKSVAVSLLKKRIETKEFSTYDDFDEAKQTLDEYLGNLTEKELDELLTSNIQNIKAEIADQTPQEFFEALPPQLQYAAKYVLDGGQDLPALFQALSQVEQTRTLNPDNDKDQETIVRHYLQAIGFGSQEEIDEEIRTAAEFGTLDKKAKQFKPKLDQLKEEMVIAQVAEQEARQKKQQTAAAEYQKKVFESLRSGELNGLKLDKKTQSELYNGMINPQYPSANGRKTNLFGHLIEKYQYVDPNYPLLMEALWLLNDPTEYKKNLIQQGKNIAIGDTVKKLKTEQSRRISSSNQDDDPGNQSGVKKMVRPINIFTGKRD